LTAGPQFAFCPLRFEFTAREPLSFPPGMAANTLRGAFGMAFRRTASSYARVFEPVVPKGEGPSGLGDSPRPFVFRARHLDGCSFEPGQSFWCDVNVFLCEPDVLADFTSAFALLAREGLGARRAKAELTGAPDRSVPPVTLDLTPSQEAPNHIRVEFLSPTELKHEGAVAERPEFPILFGRARDRISILSRLYGGGAIDLDYRASNARAATVAMTACDIRRQEYERRSSRTGQVHSIGGFVGSAEYAGDLAEFLPYLEAAKWTGVGRHAVWGKGEIDVTAI